MLSAVLILASLAPTDKLDDPTPPTPSGGIVTPVDPDDNHRPDPRATVKSLAPTPPTSPPPLVIQYHEDAATKGDLAATADRIERAIKPIDDRLVAVESRVERTGADLAALRTRVERVETGRVTTTAPPPPKVQLWELYDITGVRCTGHDPDELSRRVQQRDAYFTRKAQAPVIQPTYATVPMGYGGFSAPMSFGSFGGGFTGGGCAGGSCR